MDLSTHPTNLSIEAHLRCECPHGEITIERSDGSNSLLVRFSNKETLRYGLRTIRFAGLSFRKLTTSFFATRQNLSLQVQDETWAEFGPDCNRRIRYGKLLTQVVRSYFNW